MTYEELFERVLERIPNKYDKREGSVIWYAVASTIAELTQMYIEIEHTRSLFNLNNETGDDLTLRVKQRSGVDRLPATHAILKAELVKDDGLVDIGELFTGGNSVYEVIEHINGYDYKVRCTTAGNIGNEYTGRIIPVSAIPNLQKATITEIIEHGYNEESDESLLSRHYDRMRLPATSGNEAHYRLWAKEVKGVGEVKVVPLWSGPGTVKVIIVDENKGTASEQLLSSVYKHIETKRPVGADVTVVSAKYKNIKVESNVRIANEYTLNEIKEEFTNKLEEYRKTITFNETYVSHAKIGSLLLSTSGVLDYSDLTLNDESNNIELMIDEVPTFDIKLNLD